MNTTAKVSRHIPDIGPTLTLRRDKAYTTYPPNRKRYAIPSMDVIKEIEPNYAWTRLPNLSAYKSAIVRNKVCGGLMYLLPGDKNSTSLARPYTADLGAMFNEPYVNFKPNEYNEENVKQSSGIHFSPNTHISRLSKNGHVRRPTHTLNNDSEKNYNNYSVLVLKNNQTEEGEGSGKGNLPAQMKVGIAELQLQDEVQLILDEVDVHGAVNRDDSDERPYSSLFGTSTPGRRSNSNKKPNVASKSSPEGKVVRFKNDPPSAISHSGHTSQHSASSTRVHEFRQHHYQKKATQFKDYKELREAEVPRPKLPEELKSQYLSDRKTEEIWNWLHWDYKMSKFEYFIEVCS